MLLAIETSCDETAAAVVEKTAKNSVHILSSVVSSQIALHAPFGGVVPNLAAREHVKNIVPVIDAALREAGTILNQMEAIAVTAGPGLAPALQVGVTAAKTLSYLTGKPLLPIHHIEGHIYANFIQEAPANHHESQPTDHLLTFPLLALVVSGGHTELVLMRKHFSYEILGATEDDAAGEAFDKVAKMLGLPYPGGPEIAKRAKTKQTTQTTNNTQSTIDPSLSISFPRPLIGSGDYRFSFSGLKTAVLYFLRKHPENIQNEAFINTVCSEFQNAVVDVLTEKTRRAIIEYMPKTVIIAGGVSANTELRTRMTSMIQNEFPDTKFLMPPFKYSLDNAAMIGAAAAFRFERMADTEKKKAFATWQTLNTYPNMKLG